MLSWWIEFRSIVVVFSLMASTKIKEFLWTNFLLICLKKCATVPNITEKKFILRLLKRQEKRWKVYEYRKKHNHNHQHFFPTNSSSSFFFSSLNCLCRSWWFLWRANARSSIAAVQFFLPQLSLNEFFCSFMLNVIEFFPSSCSLFLRYFIYIFIEIWKKRKFQCMKWCCKVVAIVTSFS